MTRPAGYAEENWVLCPECVGDGHVGHGGEPFTCPFCDGEGGWPADAKRFDDEQEPDEAQEWADFDPDC